MNRKILFTLTMLVFLVSLSVFVAADSHLPVGILKMQEYNNDVAKDFLINASFFIAFLAGITTLLSPCILPLLPAYFAVTFNYKKRITLATFLFFLGFSVVFVLMGLLATLTGKALVMVFEGMNWIVQLAGLALILFGVMMILGKGFGGFGTARRFKDDWKGLLASGALFAIGWTGCIGPIISGVLLMVSTFQNYALASYLMFAYSLGLFVPLFILSFFYDKLNLSRIGWLSKRVGFTLFNTVYSTSYPNLISGGLFIMLGSVFVIFKGTWIINGLNTFGLKRYFYDWQTLFLENVQVFNVIGISLFTLFALVLVYFLIKESKEVRKDG
jgi:cytochrome c-type biogenesis protein